MGITLGIIGAVILLSLPPISFIFGVIGLILGGFWGSVTGIILAGLIFE